MEEEGNELLFYLLICELKCERTRLMECRFFCWFVFASYGLDGREMVKSQSLPLPYPCLSRAAGLFLTPRPLGFEKLQ